jgi:hypothetical protein
LKHPFTILLSGVTTMHESAFRKAQLFRRTMLAPFESAALDVLDVGSAVVAGGHASNREAFANPHWRYVGLDIEAGPNVDLIVAEPYAGAKLPMHRSTSWRAARCSNTPSSSGSPFWRSDGC